MQNKLLSQVEKYEENRKHHKSWLRIVSALACVVVFVTTYMLILPAVTLEQTAYCGCEEHQHGDACYEETLICGESENEHVHTEEYYKKTLVCQLEEHEHSLACYANPNADVESASVWEQSVSGAELTGIWADDVLAVAQTQLGYEESIQNYIVTEDGEVKGITRYGQWYGDPYGDWSGMFASFCLNYAQIPASAVPRGEYCQDWISALSDCGLYRAAGSCSPLRGDIVFLDQDYDGCAELAGFVSAVSDTGTLTVIEGDYNDAVAQISFRADAAEIIGYGLLAEHTDELSADTDAVAADDSIMPMAENSGNSAEPVDVSNYITGATLFYREVAGEEWITVTDGVVIPGDAKLKLTANFANVPLSDLLANGGVLQFELPQLLLDPAKDGDMTDENGEKIGTVSVENGILTIDFDDEWLQVQNANNVTVISGSFNVSSRVDPAALDDEGKGKLVLGDVTIIAQFEEDIAAKNGTVALTKSVSPKIVESEDGNYAEYTLTVTAGKEGCPQVRVVDHFTANSDFVSYLGVGSEAETLTSTGSPGETIAVGKAHGTVCIDASGDLVWEIGDMTANETRTLRYRVKLGENYTYLQNSEEKLISNEAQAYAAQYPKENSTANLEPKAGLNLKKTAASPVRNEDGSYTIAYTVVAQANKGNLFTLKNVRVDDCLNDPEKPTNEAYLPYMNYVDGSFLYFIGTSASGTGTALTPTMHEDGKGFSAVLGDLAPGEALTIQYQVHVGLEALTAAGGKELYINNSVKAFSDNAKKDDFDYLATSQQSKFLQYSHWAKKLVGEALTEDIDISISGRVFDATGTEPVEEINPPENFTAPAGSYLYTVLVNELGDWNVTSASMTDKLDGTYMQFVGYVKVEALDIKNGNSVVDTLWVKVDGNTSFNFTMAQLGLTGNNYSYRLSYYAQPKTVEGTAAVIVKNSFTLSGEIIPGTGDPFTLTGVTASKDVILKGGNTIEAKKLSWYYEGPTSSSGNYSKGTLYWAIKVDGDSVRAGTYIQDYLQPGTAYSYIRADSLVGLYTSPLSESDLTGFTDLNAALNSGQLTEVENDFYSVEYVIGETNQDRSSVTIKMEKTLPLDGKSLYIFIKTAPAFLPPHYFGNTLYYYNFLRTSDNGQNWTERGRANDILYEGTNLWKKVGAVFKFNGESIQETTSGSVGTILTQELGQPGMFVSWEITVNYAGELSGRYRLEDTIPDGMELAYLRVLSRGSRAQNTTVPRLTDLGADYTEHMTTANSVTAYYYTDGNSLVWDVDNLVAGRVVNNCAVTFQIVCRVTDPAVLLGGEEKQFNNQVILYGEDGRQRDIDSQSVNVSTSTLKKTVETGARTLPFTIQVNSLGEDLLAGTDYLTVVDTLSETLQLDPTSITVTNTNTGASVPYTASVEGSTLRITIPDGVPITISYKARVQVKPGVKVAIRNDAHWEGYASTSSGTIIDDDYAYAAGGTAVGSSTPTVEIIKYDSGSVTTRLPGAEFEMAEGTMDNGTFTPTEGKTWTGTTDANGVLAFGADPLMAYNTVYRIVETKAPDGYVLDAAPHYFLVAKANADGSYPEYPDGVDVWYESDTYEFRMGNGRGEASVTKCFAGLEGEASPVSGTYRFGLYDTPNPVGDPMQTVSISFADGDSGSKTAKFTNLVLGETYYLFELDDAGKPILNERVGTVNGNQFKVSYSDSATVTIGTAQSNVTVTNNISYPVLPETGGRGIGMFTIGGLTLMLAAAILLYTHSKRRKGESTFS
ncbi:MAG: SpaA isopeptide-forming pilin-related protein [Faecousia sp.]